MENHNDIYSDIFTIIHTKDEAQQCIERIGELLNEVYELKGKTYEKLIREKLVPSLADVLMRDMQLNGFDLSDERHCIEYFNGLTNELRLAKTFDLTLSINPDNELLTLIASFLAEAFPKLHLLIEVKINPGIIGGAEIVWKGKYWDFSLNKSIKDWFAAHENI
jgi:F0F1-type ATP synthase delta subunit